MLEKTDNIMDNNSTFIEDIENDIYYDIDNLNRYNKLYKRDRFKQSGQYIDVISPAVIQSDNKNILKSDSIRYLLSLYPDKEDLKKVRSIIVRPRYVEMNGSELVSLYVRKEKIIVLYLHQQYSYPVTDIKFFGLSETLFRSIGGLVPKSMQLIKSNANSGILKIPALWHILATISCSDEDKIEKFVIKRNYNFYHDNIRKLTDISYYYSHLGF
jgi:hypothetical protein